ncbi:MAG: hypothetical protein LBQ98_01020 [Nitrososphaerota archaeon]|nr:hypothetical protein [Nitrososphaerota archaeon]
MEGCFLVLKRDDVLPLCKQFDECKRQEAFIRVCNLNLKRLCYLNYLVDINVRESWLK